jgi:hypothetical protein
VSIVGGGVGGAGAWPCLSQTIQLKNIIKKIYKKNTHGIIISHKKEA